MMTIKIDKGIPLPDENTGKGRGKSAERIAMETMDSRR